MTYTEKELNQFLHGISLSLLSKKSAQHWRYDEETAKEIEWLEALERKVRADKADRKTEPQSQTEISIDKEKTLWIKMDTLEGYDRVITERGELCRIFYEDCGECAHNTDRRIELPEYEPFSDALDAMDCQSR